MNVEVQGLIRKLGEVRSLLVAMDNLNQEEVRVRKNFMQPKAVQAAPPQIKAQKKHWGGWWPIGMIVAFVIITAWLSREGTKHAMEMSQSYYDNIVFDDQWKWQGDPDDYPGYQGPVRPYTREEAFRSQLPGAIMISAGTVFVGGVILMVVCKIRKIVKKEQDTTRKRVYESNMKQSQAVEEHNRGVQAQIENIHQRKQMVSREYLTSAAPWFPEEYVFLEAVEYFIRELELGTATTLPEAIKSYREYEYRRDVGEKLQVIIENQKIGISQRDALIRQQMIGNMIAAATYAETRNIADDVRGVKAYADSAAQYARYHYGIKL